MKTTRQKSPRKAARASGKSREKAATPEPRLSDLSLRNFGRNIDRLLAELEQERNSKQPDQPGRPKRR